MFSKYQRNARIYPVLVLLLPIVILGGYFSIDYQNWYGIIGGLGLTLLLQFVMSELGRDRGKKLERNLWQFWGGTPTTQVLRYSDTTINRITKSEYHKRLYQLTNVGQEDMSSLEQTNAQEADEIYSAWSDYLRSRTRDTSAFNLIFQENVSYGFRRNVLGLKPIGMILAIICIVIIAVSEYLQIGFQLKLISNASRIAAGLLIVILSFWIFIVRKSWIRSVAFAYAERLTEASTSITS